MRSAAVTAWDNYLASVDKDRQSLKSKGMTVTAVTGADRQKIIEMLKPLTDKIRAVQ